MDLEQDISRLSLTEFLNFLEPQYFICKMGIIRSISWRSGEDKIQFKALIIEPGHTGLKKTQWFKIYIPHNSQSNPYKLDSAAFWFKL